MLDMKKTDQKKKRVRRNRRKQEKKPMDLRKNLKRLLRISVTLFSTVMIVAGGFFAVQLLMASDLFKVDQISVNGNQRLTSDTVVMLSDIETGLNTFSLDLGLIGRKIEENPWVKEARVERVFPSQVVIRIEERQPVAIVNFGYLYYLDDQGEVFKVLDANDSLNYPVVTGFDYEKAKDHDEVYVHKFKQIVALLENLLNRRQFNQKQVSEIHQNADGGLVLFTLKGSVEIKLGRDDYSKKIDRLERIYAQLEPKLNIIDYIDLNVNEKVIVRIERPNRTAKS